jgi:glyoxylase-like metal-dependent hydrolase (beta-lactamase superfamily II)
MNLLPLTPGVEWVEARPNRSFARSNAYLFKDFVVEPACEGPDEIAWWIEHLHKRPIVLTHHHIDHTFGVEEIQQATGCQVWAPPRGAPTRYTPHQGYLITQELLPGDLVGEEWRVLDAPGHEDPEHQHVVLWHETQSILVAGDATSRDLLGWPHDFCSTLGRMVALDPRTVLPGHGKPALHHSFTPWGRAILDEKKQ